MNYEAATPEGAPFPVVCTGGNSSHGRRVLGRFQRYSRAGEFWVFGEIYADGLTPPADQYLVQETGGSWIVVEEEVFRSAIVSGSTQVRSKWARQCSKCNRNYVFNLDNLHTQIVTAATSGASCLDLSS